MSKVVRVRCPACRQQRRNPKHSVCTPCWSKLPWAMRADIEDAASNPDLGPRRVALRNAIEYIRRRLAAMKKDGVPA